MEGILENPDKPRDRKNERGAALVTVMMISFLLLVASIALLLESSLNTANVTDATSEEQAYYAAESGIQTVVDVLRGNTCPTPLFTGPCYPIWDNDPTHVTSVPNRMDYFKAVKLATSNAATDPSTRPRLSRWLPYTDVTNPDSLVELGPAGSRFRFKVEVENPDNIGNSIAYTTAWQLRTDTPPPCVATPPTSILCNDPVTGNSVLFRYIPAAPAPIDVSSGEGPGSLGRWVIRGIGGTPGSFDANGATILRGSTAKRIRFAFAINLTVPYQTTKIIRGYIEKGSVGTIMPGNIGTVRIFYDSKNFVQNGSLISLEDPTGVIIQEDPNAPPPNNIPTGEGGTYRAGFETRPNPPTSEALPGVTEIPSIMTAPEPIRILIRSTGYGPRGAVKRLEAVIQKNYFNGLGAPSPLTLIGPCKTPTGVPCPSPPENSVPAFVFEPGSSTNTRYDGKDINLRAFLPPIGLTNDDNVRQVNSRLVTGSPPFNGSVFGTPENIALELPQWLKNPYELNRTLMELRATADASGTLYGVGVPRPPYGGGNYGDHLTGSGITYVEGDLEFAQKGGGILVVSGGTLTFRGGFEFNGLVVVTGRGGIQRQGGGEGMLQGNMIVAPYDPWSLNTCMPAAVTDTDKLNCFYSPRYDISGGGTSAIKYNSNNVRNGLGALTNFVKGVAEK